VSLSGIVFHVVYVIHLFAGCFRQSCSRMNDEDFLNLKNFPARLYAEQAATYLGFKPHDIPVLIATGLLKPLGGSCAAQMVKYFATAELEKLRRNIQWLSRATDAVRRHWDRKYARRSKRSNGRGGLHGQFGFTGTNSPITP
jgi:hypothetical protein